VVTQRTSITKLAIIARLTNANTGTIYHSTFSVDTMQVITRAHRHAKQLLPSISIGTLLAGLTGITKLASTGDPGITTPTSPVDTTKLYTRIRRAVCSAGQIAIFTNANRRPV